MTVDEENWMIRSSQYWHNIFHNNDIGGAFMTTHPGAFAMWLIGAGEVMQEQRLGIDVDQSNLHNFRIAATLPIALATAFLIGVTVWLLTRLVGLWPAATAGFLLAVDPYLAGMSQIAHLDALLALCMLNALSSFGLYLRYGNRRYVILAALFTGLALSTKLLPALWLFVFTGFVLGLVTFRKSLRHWFVVVQQHLAVYSFFIIMSFAVLVAVWPALLTVPDFYVGYISRDAETIVTDEHVAIEESEEPIAPASFYLRTVLGRTTPLVFFVSLAMAVYVASRAWRERKMPWSGWLLLYALGYLIGITFIAKKGDRYALPALVALTVVAGEGLVIAWQLLCHRFQGLHEVKKRAVVISALVISLVVQSVAWMPYAVAYNNPFFSHVRSLTQQGWGEGLDAAAAWLNEQPLANEMYVASWYPGVLQTYYKGPVLSLSSRHDHRVGFVVTYRNMESRAEDDIASNVLDEFVNKQPVHTVYIGGQPYVWIYQTIGPHYFPQHVGEITSGIEVGQTVPVETDNWSAVDLAFATFGRENTGSVTLHVRESVQSSEDIRTVTVDAGAISDRDWQRFEFEPIRGSAGKTHYVAVTADGTVGNAVTIRYSSQDILPGQAFIRGQLRSADIGYSLPQ